MSGKYIKSTTSTMKIHGDKQMKEVIEKVLLFDTHQSSTKDNAISTTTLIGSNWKAQRDMLKDEIKKQIIEIIKKETLTKNQLRAKFPKIDINQKIFELEFNDEIKVVAGLYRIN